MGYDDQEFEAFYRKHYAMVYWYFRRARAADDEAHDLAQEVFTRVWKSWKTYRREAAWTFLKTISLRVLLDRNRRRQAAMRLGEEMSIDDPAIVAKLFELPRDIEETVQRQLLYKLMSRLPPITGKCVQHWINGWSYEEIAKEMDLSVDAVSTRLRDAKRMMKEDYDAQQY